MDDHQREDFMERKRDLGRYRGLVLAGLGLFAGACTPIPSWRSASTLPRTPEPAPPDDGPLARSVEDRALYCSVHGTGARTVLLMGAIHGNEPGSHVLVRAFEEWIAERPSELRGLRLVVTTPVNPDGLVRGTRHNANGVDLNRNFPARNYRPGGRRGRKPLSEPESRFVQALLERYRPGLVISVHQPRRSVNYDGPAREIAEAMARYNGYRVEDTVGYSTPGSLGSWVGVDQQVPIITLELPRRPAAGKTFLEENLGALRAALAMVASASSEGAAATGK
jgi:protein MpaA